jgi:hypothetical protein
MAVASLAFALPCFTRSFLGHALVLVGVVGARLVALVAFAGFLRNRM